MTETNPFFPMFQFYIPEITRNQRFSYNYKGYEMGRKG